MKTRLPQNLLIVLAFALGVASAFLDWGPLLSLSQVISTIIVKSLKLISLPVIFFSIIATLSGMESFKTAKVLGGRVFKYTVITTLLSGLLAFSLYLILAPTPISSTSIASPENHPSLFATILDLYPSNIVRVFAEDNVIGIVILAGTLGFAILSLPAKQKEPLHQFFQSVFAAFLKIASFIISFLPLAIWAFVTIFVSTILKEGFGAYKPLYLYFLVVVLANLLQAFVVLPLFLKSKGLKPVKIFKGVAEALSVAFFSKSSNATLPITMKNVEDNLNIPKRISAFSLPLCSTINMNACAAFIFTTVIFVSTSYGYTFSIFDMLLWVVIATIAAIGNAGVPMGCYFLAGALLSGMGVPLELLGLILPAYAILDMIETAVNVWSDCCVTTVVAKEEAAVSKSATI